MVATVVRIGTPEPLVPSLIRDHSGSIWKRDPEPSLRGPQDDKNQMDN